MTSGILQPRTAGGYPSITENPAQRPEWNRAARDWAIAMDSPERSRTGEPPRRRVVLLGAGHAHLYTIKRASAFAARGIELVLVAPDNFWYSGLATGMLGGIYPPELDQVDVGALVNRGGGRFLRDRATAIDVESRTIHLESGPPLAYDALSLDLGSEVPVDSVPGLAEFGTPVKPIRNLWRLRQELEARFRSPNASKPVRVLVLGGGATACELGGNLLRLARDHNRTIAITLVTRGERILESFGRRLAEGVSRNLRRRGIEIVNRANVVHVGPGVIRTEDGRTFSFDHLISAIGLVPSLILRETGLPTDDQGALRVDAQLRSIADARIHGGGDCVALEGHSLAKVGVYAIRQAPILFHNLLASVEDRAPRTFRPQSRFLLILNLGDGTGLATWGPLHWQGRAAYWLKDWIDRRFLAGYQNEG